MRLMNIHEAAPPPPPQLVALLREVKYLKQRGGVLQQPMPDSAATVYGQNETYRRYMQSLDVVVSLYNSVRESVIDVELPLVEGQLEDIDQQLHCALTELNWTSEGAVACKEA